MLRRARADGLAAEPVRVFDLQEELRARGFEIMDYATDSDYTARSGLLLVRVLRDREEVLGSRRHGFDRWAISTEIEAAIPYSEAELDAFLAKLLALGPSP